MERKRKKINLKFIVLILSLIVFLGMSVLTFAWFTDSKSYTGTLNFGELKLKVSGGVSGDGVTSATSKLIFDTARKLNNDSTWTGKYMPGDTIDLNLTVGLESSSEPAYYMISITDNKNVFERAYYYSDGTKTGNNLNVFVFNKIKTYKQGDDSKTELTGSDLKYVGKLDAGDSNAHSLTISAKISENFEEQGIKTTVNCEIFAIQQANLKEITARVEMMNNNVDGLDTSKYTRVNYLKSTSKDTYIDTQIKPASNMRFICDGIFQSYPHNYSNCDNYVFGLGSAWNIGIQVLINRYGNVWAICSGQTKVVYNNSINAQAYGENLDYYDVNFDFLYNLTSVKFHVNGKEINGTFDELTDLFTDNFYLFTTNSGSELTIKKDKIIYKFEMYSNESLVRNFIPCLRNSDNKPGMFDTVSGTFFTNVGTGEFLWG